MVYLPGRVVLAAVVAATLLLSFVQLEEGTKGLLQKTQLSQERNHEDPADHEAPGQLELNAAAHQVTESPKQGNEVPDVPNGLYFLQQPLPSVPKGVDLSHFLIHTPKAGGRHTISTLHKLLSTQPEFAQQGRTFAICDHGSDKLHKFKNLSKSKKKCTMHTSETPFSPHAKYSYGVVRNPKHHTLSEYNHCTEAPVHKRWAHKMPQNLTSWLEAWDEALTDPKKAKENEKFNCFNPTNFQSNDLHFNPATEDKEALSKRFRVLGDMDRIDPTICVIFIRYTGWVPAVCDCTATAGINPTPKPVKGHSHGVKHHGASQSTTPHQDALIARLRAQDMILVEYAKEIFTEQLQETEKEFNIKICDRMK